MANESGIDDEIFQYYQICRSRGHDPPSLTKAPQVDVFIFVASTAHGTFELMYTIVSISSGPLSIPSLFS